MFPRTANRYLALNLRNNIVTLGMSVYCDAEKKFCFYVNGLTQPMLAVACPNHTAGDFRMTAMEGCCGEKKDRQFSEN